VEWFAGVAPFGELKPVKKFTDRKVAVGRISQAIQRIEATEITPEPMADISTAEVTSLPESAAATELATVAPQVPDVAPEVAPSTTDATLAESAPAEAVAEPASIEQTATKQPKRKKASKPAQDSATPRETKLSQVVAMLQRPEGAPITEIMSKMGWLKHTVRGFMAGTMKKAGYNVESLKLEGGERSYRINPK
jgi:hypothetical protein